jgi:hypothetical protein
MESAEQHEGTQSAEDTAADVEGGTPVDGGEGTEAPATPDTPVEQPADGEGDAPAEAPADAPSESSPAEGGSEDESSDGDGSEAPAGQ